jgi:hypothetical protein
MLNTMIVFGRARADGAGSNQQQAIISDLRLPIRS